MKNIITVSMAKRGIGTVVLKQGEYIDGTRFYTITANGITTSLKDGNALNMAYKQYLNAGWTAKFEAEKPEEKKAAAPKEPKPKKSWKEHLTETFGEKEDRKHFVEVRNRIAVTAINYFRQKYIESEATLSREEYKKAEKKFVNDWANRVIAAEAAC